MRERASRWARHVGLAGLVAAMGAVLALGTSCAFPDTGVPGRVDADGGDGGPIAPAIDAAAVLGGEVVGDTADDVGYARACLDGVDADSSGGADCADDECNAAPSCCVGSTTRACCNGGAGPLYTLTFTGCSLPSDCGAPSDVIGAPVLGAGIVAAAAPGATADSGVLVRAPLDLRSGHLTLTASVVVESAPGAMVDAVAIGLFAEDAGGARSLPVAAIQISASLGEIGIVAGDVVVASYEITASAAPRTLTLTVTPAGAVTLVGDGFELTTTVTVPSTPLRVGVLGRSELATPSPVRVESVTVLRDACDVPSALVPGALSLDDRTGLYDASSVASPSFALGPSGERVLSFDAEQLSDGRRAIFLGVEDATRPGTFVVEATSGRPQPILTSSTFVEEVSDPALGWSGELMRWVLYATGIANGRRAIVRSDGAADGTFAFPAPIALAAPADEFVSGMEPERDSPALVPGDPTVIVAREHTPLGPALVLIDVRDAAAAGRVGAICGVDDVCDAPSLRTSQTIVSRRVGTLEIDADEVASPSVGYYRGVYRLYYAGRRGLRWSIGLVISADARYWRYPPGGGVALVPTGNGAAALGALDPDVTIDGSGNLSLFYTAWNGIDTTVALATQAIRL